MEKKDMEEKNKSFRSVMTEFMGYTSGHGFGRLVAATSFVWRAFWILAVIVAFGMFIVEVMSLFKIFFSRPVQTSVSVTFEKQLEFPAVTICNLNMIKRRSVMQLPEDWASLNLSYYGDVEEKNNLTRNTKLPNVVNTTLSPTDSGKVDTGQTTKSLDITARPTTDQLTGQSTLPKGNKRRKREDGTEKGSDKSYDTPGGSEDYRDEDGKSGNGGNDEPDGGGYDDKSYDGDYGYDDDWKNDEDYSSISDEYPDESKLTKELILRIKVEELIGGEPPEFLYSLGHQQKDLIRSCTWKGVDCLTGNFSNFWKWRWNYRYGNCYTFNDGMDDWGNPLRILKSSKPGPSQGLVLQLNIEDDEYLGELSEEAGVRVVLHEPGSMPFPYEEGFSISPGMATSVGLTKTFIKRLDRFNDGSCSEEGVPLGTDNLYRKHKNTTRYSLQACLNSCLGESQLAICDCAEASFPSGQAPCDFFDVEKRECLKMVKFLFSKDQLPCIDECKRPCREEIYEKTISSSQWPSSAFREYMNSFDLDAPSPSDGLLLNVFYSQLNYQVIEETFSYGTTNLLADIGGQLGLWIGISALTCGEILELIFQLLVLAYTKLKSRRQNRVIEIGQTTE